MLQCCRSCPGRFPQPSPRANELGLGFPDVPAGIRKGTDGPKPDVSSSKLLLKGPRVYRKENVQTQYARTCYCRKRAPHLAQKVFATNYVTNRCVCHRQRSCGDRPSIITDVTGMVLPTGERASVGGESIDAGQFIIVSCGFGHWPTDERANGRITPPPRPQARKTDFSLSRFLAQERQCGRCLPVIRMVACDILTS